MKPVLTATVLPEFAAVRLVLTDAPAGPLEVLREDVNGTRAVRQLPGQETSAGSLVLVDYEPAMLGPVTYSVQGTRTNVLLNPSAEVNASNWSNSRITIARLEQLSEISPSGTSVFRGTANATAGPLSQYVFPGTTAPAVAGQVWSAGVSVRRSSAGKVRLQLSYLNAGGSQVGAWSTEPTLAANTWAQLLVTTAPAPATTTQLRLYVFAADELAIGATMDWDAAWLVNDPTPGTYLEGTAPVTITTTVNPTLTPDPRVSVLGRPANTMTVQAIETYSETSDSGTRLVTIYGGGDLPIVSGLDARKGSVGLHVPTYTLARQLRELLASGAIVQLRQATYQGMDLYLTPDRVGITPAPQDNAPAEWVVSIDYSEADTAMLDSIDLASGAAWTVADVAAMFATCDDVLGAFPTCHALAVGP